MSWGKSRQEVPKTPPRATTTVAEEAVVEEVPEGYAERRKQAKGLLEAKATQAPGFVPEVEGDKPTTIAGFRPALPSKSAAGIEGGALSKEGPGEFVFSEFYSQPVEPELSKSILTLPAYPEEPSGEALNEPYVAKLEGRRAAETAAEVYLRRLNRPVDEMDLRGEGDEMVVHQEPGMSREEGLKNQRDFRARKAKSLGLMDFGTLNQTYDHMSIPLLDAYMKQLQAREAELKKLIAAEVGRSRIEGRSAKEVYAEEQEMDKGLPYAQNYKPDILNWVQRSFMQAQATKAQMERIKQALEAEAKSDKK